MCCSKLIKAELFLLGVEFNWQLSLQRTKKVFWVENNLIVIRPGLVLLPALKAFYILEKCSALNVEEMKCWISLIL